MKRLHFLTVLLAGGIAVFSQMAAAQAQARTSESIRDAVLNPRPDRVLVAAHRGLSGKSTGSWDRHPENSLSAIRESIAKGIDILEIDVRKTKDGQLILMHDETIDRTTDGKGKVRDLTLDELRKFRLKLGVGGPGATVTEEGIPTLTEVMELVRGKCLVNLDKAGSLFRECSEVLKATGTAEQAIIKSSEPADNCAKQIAKLEPGVLFMPIVSGKGAEAAEAETLGRIESYKPLKAAAFEIVFKDDRDPIVKEASIAAIRSQGSGVWINSLWPSLNGGHDDARSLKFPSQGWGWLVDRGANIIQSDESEALIRYLEEQGKRKWK